MKLPTPNWITVTNGGKLPMSQQPFWIKRSCHPEIILYKGTADPQSFFSTPNNGIIAWLPADEKPYCVPIYPVIDEAEESWIKWNPSVVNLSLSHKNAYKAGYNNRKAEEKV